MGKSMNKIPHYVYITVWNDSHQITKPYFWKKFFVENELLGHVDDCMQELQL